jgi:hypothetical protein
VVVVVVVVVITQWLADGRSKPNYPGRSSHVSEARA